jgi:hypothetical protein
MEEEENVLRSEKHLVHREQEPGMLGFITMTQASTLAAGPRTELENSFSLASKDSQVWDMRRRESCKIWGSVFRTPVCMW